MNQLLIVLIVWVIAAGADLKTKNKDGLTALELAKNYYHAAMVSLLAGKAALR